MPQPAHLHAFRTLIAATLLLGVTACSENEPAANLTRTDCTAPRTLADGSRLIGHTVGNTCAWLGVPFAAAPVGERRFAPPAPPPALDRVADRRGRDCIQTLGPFVEQGIDEDCLQLNVWTPATRAPDDGPLPVMLWFFGGGFMGGSAHWSVYDGRHFASHDVMIVAANYRLGPLGYLATSDVTRPDGTLLAGNLGLLDQLAALQWVAANAAALGGDPERITVFGESAGAFSTCALLAMPEARPLIRRAIMQSGVCGMGSPEDTRDRGRKWLRSTGCPVSGPESLACLNAQDPLTWPSELPYSMFDGIWPVVDGEVLPEHPLTALEAGRAGGIDLLAGYNAHEVNVFGLTPAFWDFRSQSFAELRAFLRPHFTEAENAALDRLYPDQDYASAFDRGADMMGDMIFGCPAHDAVRAQTPHGRTWLYRWNVGDDSYVLAPHLGSFHGLDVLFTWGNLGYLEAVAGGDDIRTLRALSDRMLRLWSRFAADGDPNGPGDPAWQPFAEGGARYELGPEAFNIRNPLGERCALWQQRLPLPIGERFQEILDILLPGETGLF